MTKLRRRTAALSAALLLVVLGAMSPASAQDWPTKPVRILTPFPPGAGPDAMLRVIAEKLQKKWGQSVIIENKPGANGFIAIDTFKRGATDGSDLIQIDNVHLAAYPHLFKKLPYDPAKDFDVLLPLNRTAFFITVPANSKYQTVGDILADAKAHPGALNYGSWSLGNPAHLGGALLESLSGTRMEHIIYKETSMLYTGVASGELNFALGTIATAGPLQRAGRIKFLAVTTAKRHPAFPDVPTIAESGGPANYEMTGWTTLAAPKNLPKAVAEKIQRDVEAVMTEADVKGRYAALGYDLFPTTRQQFNTFMSAESLKYADVISHAKVSID